MKKYILLFLIPFCTILNAQVKWMNFTDALAQQKIAPKKIMVDFYTDWCKPCKEMDVKTYGNPDIANFINENYYAVRFEADGLEEVEYLGRKFPKPTYVKNNPKRILNSFTRFMNVSSVPATVFLDEEANPITNINGYLTANELEVYLKMISNDDYKKIKTKEDWEIYTTKLNSKIKK